MMNSGPRISPTLWGQLSETDPSPPWLFIVPITILWISCLVLACMFICNDPALPPKFYFAYFFEVFMSIISVVVFNYFVIAVPSTFLDIVTFGLCINFFIALFFVVDICVWKCSRSNNQQGYDCFRNYVRTTWNNIRHETNNATFEIDEESVTFDSQSNETESISLNYIVTDSLDGNAPNGLEPNTAEIGQHFHNDPSIIFQVLNETFVGSLNENAQVNETDDEKAAHQKVDSESNESESISTPEQIETIENLTQSATRLEPNTAETGQIFNDDPSINFQVLNEIVVDSSNENAQVEAQIVNEKDNEEAADEKVE